jgi:hypothetical protein
MKMNILFAFSQRRHFDMNNVNTLKQVTAKAAVFHFFIDVLIGGRNNSNIDFDRLMATERTKFFFFNGLKQFALHVQGNLQNFIKKYNASIGL